MNPIPPTPPDLLAAVQAAVGRLPTITVDEETYLASSAAMETAAQILYPEGIQTEAAFQHVCQVAAQACALLGFGEERQLNPPAVPFEARGAYRQQMPLLAASLVSQILGEMRPTTLTNPQEAISQSSLLRLLALKSWERPFEALAVEEQGYLKQRCDQVAVELGWQVSDQGPVDRRWPAGQAAYVRPLQADYPQMRQALADLLQHGRPVAAQSVRRHGLAAAFGPGVSQDPAGLVPAEKWAAVLSELGYEAAPDNEGFYQPRPVALPDGVDSTMRKVLAAIEPVATRSGPALLLDEVVAAALAAVALNQEQIRPGVLEQLISDGPIGQALILLGYKPQYHHARAWEFEPPRDDRGAQIFPRAAQFKAGGQTIAAASGFSVQAPVLVRDNATLVYLELLGPRQAVQANWAALRSGGRNQWVAGASLSILKSDRLVTLKQALPIGWDHWCLIHGQASAEHLLPGRPFYLLDDGRSAIPPAFYPLLSRSLALPLLPAWIEYLWVAGRQRELIGPLTQGCHGRGAWRVKAEEAGWQEVVQKGLAESRVCF